MSIRLRGLAASGAATALLTTGLLATGATAAHAATPVCTKTKLITKGAYYAELPVSAGGSTTCQMGPGNTSSAVKQLQFVLTVCHGLGAGGSDGIYGNGTRADVRTVQRAAGINADGLYGPNTRNIIKWRWYGTSNETPKCAKL
ncbi:peptidoglycan-binding domain-containing protein [Streptomyces sp. NPDC041068]|uniref:peptidoglycan-binding domain-containing protein n=1 Tax=Streptomyces sp. NPDC041068 TaxID=3155130 RepID=UPI0033F9CA92